MKCPGCDGKGFIEKHYGLLTMKCSECKGTGEIDMEEYMQGQIYGKQEETDVAVDSGTVEVDKPARVLPTRKPTRARKHPKSRKA